MNSVKKRVCIIGLDGVGLHNLKLIMEFVSLSSLATFLSKSFHSSFISIPPYTPSAWTTIFTGVNPGKHGIYGFYKVDSSNINLATSHYVMYPRVFEMLSMFKQRSIVINVPLTYPPQALIGLRNLVVISDWASPKQFIHPRQYEERYREYFAEPPHRWAMVVNVKDYVRKVEEFLATRLNIYYDLLEREDFNLFVVIFSELDWLMHRIPDLVVGRQLHYVYKILALIDDFIGRATEVCDLVVLVSDHGFRVSRIFIGVNRILADKGLLTYRYKYNIGKLLHGSQYPGFKHGEEAYSSHTQDLILRRLFTLARRLIPLHVLSRLQSLAPISVEIDYNSSIAFMLEASNWGIHVKNGWLNTVKEVFTQNNYVKKILTKHDVFWGPYTSLAPDLILVPRDYVFFDARVYSEPIYMDYIGEHEPHALIALHGDDVVPSKSSDMHVNIYDIAPTVLAYLGLPLPHNTDGRVLSEILPSLPRQMKKFNYLQRFKILRKIKAKSMASLTA